jgi:hypothetical protein
LPRCPCCDNAFSMRQLTCGRPQARSAAWISGRADTDAYSRALATQRPPTLRTLKTHRGRIPGRVLATPLRGGEWRRPRQGRGPERMGAHRPRQRAHGGKPSLAPSYCCPTRTVPVLQGRFDKRASPLSPVRNSGCLRFRLHVVRADPVHGLLRCASRHHRERYCFGGSQMSWPVDPCSAAHPYVPSPSARGGKGGKAPSALARRMRH